MSKLFPVRVLSILSVALMAVPQPALAGITVMPVAAPAEASTCVAMPFDDIKAQLVAANFREPRLVEDKANPLVVDASQGAKRLRLLVDGCSGEVLDIQKRPRA